MSTDASSLEEVTIRLFRRSDQAAARRLILHGLRERWGKLDETKNPDLDDIADYYSDGFFLVAGLRDEVIGTGALIPEAAGVGRIVRMSVARPWRRQGVGQRILEALLERARAAGYRRVVLETTATWEDAVAFYRRHGFQTVAVRDGNAHFMHELEDCQRLTSP